MGELEELIFTIIELTALSIEVLAVIIIAGAVLVGMVRYLMHAMRGGHLIDQRFAAYRLVLGRALLLGLEILVAADIIKTVVLEPSVQSVAVLGILVLIRIFLGWSLIVEMEGHWPWQGKGNADEPENPPVEDGASAA